LVVGVHGEQIEVPGALGHPFGCVVGDGRGSLGGSIDEPVVVVRRAGQECVEGGGDVGQLLRRE